ncbi:MAG TPA: histidine phosphatase family protein [Candidatus Saccharimonadales bacterium]|jgi:probable phosphoglycerate mutase|nr:histidine phosphatase family protein [Candidatus Saccharimonadales bacterium]
MQSIYFIRHGASEANLAHLTAGQLDSPLSNQGRQQANKTGQELRKAGRRFDVIVSSTLSRSAETAQIIADMIDYPYDHIVYSPDLCERFCGDFEGQPFEDYKTTPEDVAAATYHVESIQDLYVRAKKVATWLETTYPGQEILVVSHSGIGKMLRIVLSGSAATTFDKTRSLPNATVLQFR